MIYTLNTKNDEHEQFVARLKATHSNDLDSILSQCSYKLQLCEEKLQVEREASGRKLVDLKDSFLAIEKQRNQLLEEQVSSS